MTASKRRVAGRRVNPRRDAPAPAPLEPVVAPAVVPVVEPVQPNDELVRALRRAFWARRTTVAGLMVVVVAILLPQWPVVHTVGVAGMGVFFAGAVWTLIAELYVRSARRQ